MISQNPIAIDEDEGFSGKMPQITSPQQQLQPRQALGSIENI